VDESGEGQLRGANSSAESLLGLAYQDAPTRARERDCGGQPIRARADDDYVASAAQLTSASIDERASRTISRAITRRWISFVPS
jgi:hypothetical protein